MGETKCYAMVRGSAIRVTGLGRRGSIPDTIPYATSKSVAKITLNEITEAGSDDFLGSDENDNDNRLRFLRSAETIRYTADIDFVRCDPGILNLIANVPLIYSGSAPGFGGGAFGESLFGGDVDEDGFGEFEFGEFAFGEGGEPDVERTVVGFDARTRQPAASFAMEVWSKLAGAACVDGERQYGYTVFPFLRGGYLSGFKFENALVSFNLRGAQTRRVPRWGVGPYDLTGTHQRLVTPVSRNTMYRQMLTTAVPPMEESGIQETEDVIYGGTSSVTSDDVIEGGDSSSTSPWIIYGGQAV